MLCSLKQKSDSYVFLHYNNSENSSRVEEARSEFCCKPQFTFMVLMPGMQSSAMSTGMDTIWDLHNINSSRLTSLSTLSAPRRHWQIHKGMNEIAISSQFPPALPQRLSKRTLTFLWLTAVCVERKAIQGQTSTLKPAYNILTCSALLILRLFTFLYVARSHRSAVKTCLPFVFPYGHQFSLPAIAFLSCPSSSDLRLQFHVASGACLEQTPTCVQPIRQALD